MSLGDLRPAMWAWETCVRNIPSLRLTNTNPTETREVMSNIKQTKATGYDLIRPRAVRLSADVLCYRIYSNKPGGAY